MKVQWGMMMVAGSGKLGGQVASTNKGGPYLRTKVVPHNPQTVSQQAVRSLLTNVSKTWSTLTSAQIAAWNAVVGSWQTKNTLGNTMTLDGKNLFTKLNINLANVGEAQIVDPPLPAELSIITGLALTATAPATMSLAWTSGAVPATEAWLTRATVGVPLGKFFVKNLYRVFKTIAPAATTPSNLAAAYTAKFGDLVSGQRVFVSVEQIDIATGTPGVPQIVSCIVT